MIKKHIELFARYAGFTAICFEWLAILLFYVIKPGEFSGDRTISYFASLPETRIVFSVCLTVAAVSFWIFTRYHLYKFYNVPLRLFAMSMIGYAVLAVAPFDPASATSELVHKVLAIFFSITFLAGIYFMGKNNNQPKLRVVSYGALVLSGFALLLFFTTPGGGQIIFLIEAASAFVGQLWVVWISFHSFKDAPSRQ